MGKYTFTWAHPANEVFVTGDFDDWKKTVKLEKEGDVFKKTIELPKTKHHYKFVVDGNWLTNESHPKEQVDGGIYNNVLHPHYIEETEDVSTLSSAAPESSTAALAANVPKESTHGKVEKEQEAPVSAGLPGAFPETPGAASPAPEQAFSVNPLPATDGPGNPIKLGPGENVPDPSTFTSNTVQSTVRDNQPAGAAEDATVSVAPVPATAGPGNPIHLEPGEKVPDPSTLTSNTVSSTAKTDAASYEKSDALPPQLSPVALTPEAEREAKGGMFSLPPLTGSLIPESSLPKDVNTESEQDPGVTIQSAAPASSTAALAAQVSKEPRGVPETVIASQKEAHDPPEASANPEAVEEKKEVEQELKETVPAKPATTDITTEKVSDTVASGASTAAAAATAAAATVAGAVTAAAYSAKDKAAEAVGLNGQATASDTPAPAPEPEPEAPASDVPEVVAESLREAHASPEAAAYEEVVEEKKEVEAELLKKVPTSEEHGEPAPSLGNPGPQKGGLYNQALVTEVPTVATESHHAANDVPEVVAESQEKAHASPEAAANQEAVEEKKEVEEELLKKVKPTDEAGEPAPTLSAATATTAPAPSTEVHAHAAKDVPEVVAESLEKAHASPEAAANEEAVEEKKEVEAELLKKVPTTEEHGEPAPSTTTPPKESAAATAAGGLNAPASSQAQSAATPSAAAASSRDVSPMSKQPTTASQTQPTVTTGTETTTTAAKTEAATPATETTRAPETPAKAAPSSAQSTPESSAAGTDKKKKRTSIFGKLKQKFKDL
ncbi:uncharacterized protein EI97DRAFT_224309 [Westerdykella ornata]|uniref:AMP-activated protein kinase glycogen-binding domain-containing protein n=1 Tax=Westerdykella ornata TaxID=318751 RepID=A0A6A6JSW6_WESOR|nr:uncharacterized protein EI97DRAFT_224309 [Westerdykella ornata]KAF2278958.1 hypothetical protein EI97DRAFT_224309 [Westerdykella ornata]